VNAPLPAGWYYADGDPPGTHRYWDGSIWQGGPQAVATPGFAPPKQLYAEGSQGVAALVLSILGFVGCCLITCPIGWYLGDAEIQGIEAGHRDPANHGMANAGRIIGIVGTVLLVLAVVAYGGLIGLSAVFAQ
jgi:hypothetical protein